MIDWYELLFWTAPIGFFMLFAPEQKQPRPTVRKSRTVAKTKKTKAKAVKAKTVRPKKQKASKPEKLSPEQQRLLDNYFMQRDNKKGSTWNTTNYGGTLPL